MTTRSVFANDKFVKLKQDVTRQRERDFRNENASLNTLISKERGIISTQIGKASVDKMNSQDK